MPFNTDIISNFNIANETPVSDGGIWRALRVDGVTASLRVQSNQCDRGSAGQSGQSIDTVYTANQELYFTLVTLPSSATSDEVAIYLRVQDDANFETTNWGGYYVTFLHVATVPTFRFFKHETGDVWTQLGSDVTQIVTAGCQIGARIMTTSTTTSDLELWLNAGSGWQHIDTRTVTDYQAGGYTGIALHGATAVIDNVGGGSVTTRQSAYRWRFDNGNETSAGWVDAVNTPIPWPFDTVRRLRIQVDATAATVAVNPVIQVRARGVDAWSIVPIPSLATSLDPFVVEITPNIFPPGAPTTSQLPIPVNKTPVNYQPGQILDNSSFGTLALLLATAGFSEYEWALKRSTTGAAVEDTWYEFRIAFIEASSNAYPVSVTFIPIPRYESFVEAFLGLAIPPPPPVTAPPAPDPTPTVPPPTTTTGVDMGLADSYRTFEDLWRGVLISTRASDTKTTSIDYAKRLINTANQDLHLGNDYRMPWSAREATIVTRPRYNTGTVTATRGQAEVGGSGTLWNTIGTPGATNVEVGGEMTINGEPTIYRIVAITDDFTLTIDPPYIGATISGATYDSWRRDYVLAVDFAKPFAVNFFDDAREICLTDRHTFNQHRTQHRTPNRPIAAIIRTIGPDSVNTILQRRVSLLPPPDRQYVIPYTYVTQHLAISSDHATGAIDMVDDTDEPIIPRQERHVLWLFAMYHWYTHKKDDPVRAAAIKLDYEQTVARLMSNVEVGSESLSITPQITSYARHAIRPYSQANTRRFDIGNRFDRLEDR